MSAIHETIITALLIKDLPTSDLRAMLTELRRKAEKIVPRAMEQYEYLMSHNPLAATNVIEIAKLGHPFTADEIGLSGSAMRGMLSKNIVRVVDHKTTFIPYAEDLYRKVRINVYESNITLDLIDIYENMCEIECELHARRIQERVSRKD